MNHLIPTYDIPTLPPAADLETPAILKALVQASRYLAELKGTADTIPNQSILLDTLALQEAKASSEIENIITTQDELFQADLFPTWAGSAAAKEVALYRDALKLGYDALVDVEGISNRSIIEMFRLLKGRSDGFRTTGGTTLKNDRTNDVIYIPPQRPDAILRHMSDLEAFMNSSNYDDIDPIIKMAIIHHQFESIHPFTDGNGRLGRILNILYLVHMKLLDTPILYLSRYITDTKSDYYRLLQAVRDDGAWEQYIVYMLNAISDTSKTTLKLIEGLRTLMATYKSRLRNELPEIYSQDLLNNLFRHPYTRIEYVQSDLGISRPTASKYLEALVEKGLLEKIRSGRRVYFVNSPLIDLFLSVSDGR